MTTETLPACAVETTLLRNTETGVNEEIEVAYLDDVDWSTVSADAIAGLVLQRIREHPDAYGQQDYVTYPDPDEEGSLESTGQIGAFALFGSDPIEWDCGVTACVAGHAAAIVYGRERKKGRHLRGYVRAVARRALGLGYSEAEWAFSADRTLEQVESVLQAIGTGRDVTVRIAELRAEGNG